MCKLFSYAYGMNLYHGTSVGWLHISGFNAPNFKYGELSGEDPFMYLCTQREGAISAAYKACTQVKSRNEWKKPSKHLYKYEEVQYEFCPYVYEISFNENIRVLDFFKDKLNRVELKKVKLAIVFARTYKKNKKNRLILKVARWLEWCKVSRQLNKSPECWGNILHKAFYENRRYKLYSLSYFGFDLFRNIEGDGDGQGYGEVWGLSFRAYGKEKISPPEIYMLYQ